MKLVIVTGMSGAGKTIALKMLEDLGEDAFMTRAALEKFTRLRDQGFGERFTERPKTFDEVLRVKYLLENGDVNDV